MLLLLISCLGRLADLEDQLGELEEELEETQEELAALEAKDQDSEAGSDDSGQGDSDEPDPGIELEPPVVFTAFGASEGTWAFRWRVEGEGVTGVQAAIVDNDSNNAVITADAACGELVGDYRYEYYSLWVLVWQGDRATCFQHNGTYATTGCESAFPTPFADLVCEE